MSKVFIPSSYGLLQFYKAYLKWATSFIVVDNAVFHRESGLCPNLRRFENGHTSWRLYREMKNQFSAAGLSSVYPFGYADYNRRSKMLGSHHRQRERLQWVRDRIADGSDVSKEYDFFDKTS